MHVIRSFRRELGLTQAAFAEEVGCTGASLSQIENGKRRLGARVARLIVVYARKIGRAITYESLLENDEVPDSDVDHTEENENDVIRKNRSFMLPNA